jgi:hypothetical protein
LHKLFHITSKIRQSLTYLKLSTVINLCELFDKETTFDMSIIRFQLHQYALQDSLGKSLSLFYILLFIHKYLIECPLNWVFFIEIVYTVSDSKVCTYIKLNPKSLRIEQAHMIFFLLKICTLYTVVGFVEKIFLYLNLDLGLWKYT